MAEVNVVQPVAAGTVNSNKTIPLEIAAESIPLRYPLIPTENPKRLVELLSERESLLIAGDM